MTEPFTYPAAAHRRRHGPRGYSDYDSYRPWLRDEFSFRCVYCLLREQWGRVRGVWALDHFLAAAHHPAQVTDYDNLLYTCVTCNAAKADRAVPDPLVVLTGQAIRVKEDGSIEASTPEASRLIELLGLDSPQSTEFRMLWIGIVALAARHDPELYRRLVGYPDDLPDLRRLRPPDGNARPQGINESSFAQRARGTLRATY